MLVGLAFRHSTSLTDIPTLLLPAALDGQKRSSNKSIDVLHPSLQILLSAID